jgi:5-methylcytosine-specific restriction endonuclease McrA
MRRREQERKTRHDRNRPSASARGYDHSWRQARAQFLASNPTCRKCGTHPATVVDHIMPHKGNKALFWNRANWQPLCVRCHSSLKQSEERRSGI